MYLKSLGQSYTGIPIPDTLKNQCSYPYSSKLLVKYFIKMSKNFDWFLCTIFFFQTKIFLPIPYDRFCKITKKDLTNRRVLYVLSNRKQTLWHKRQRKFRSSNLSINRDIIYLCLYMVKILFYLFWVWSIYSKFYKNDFTIFIRILNYRKQTLQYALHNNRIGYDN